MIGGLSKVNHIKGFCSTLFSISYRKMYALGQKFVTTLSHAFAAGFCLSWWKKGFSVASCLVPSAICRAAAAAASRRAEGGREDHRAPAVASFRYWVRFSAPTAAHRATQIRAAWISDSEGISDPDSILDSELLPRFFDSWVLELSSKFCQTNQCTHRILIF